MRGRPVPPWSELVGLVGDELREHAIRLILREAPSADVVFFGRFDRREGGFRGVVASGRRPRRGVDTAPRTADALESERLGELVSEHAPWHGPAFDEVERGAWDAPRAGGRAFLAVPVSSRGLRPYPLGTLCVVGAANVGSEDAAAVTEIALAMAIAIEVADRDHDAVARVRDMEATVRNLRASAQVARAVAAESDLTTLFELIVDQGRRLSRARGMVALVERDGVLRPVAEAGQVTDAERVGDAPAAYTAPMTFRGERLGLLTAFAGEAASEGVVAAAVPEHGHPLAEDAPRALGAEAEQLLRAFAASAATAVASTRSASEARVRRTVRAAELERRRWARELHDETLQGLAAVRLLLETGMGAPTEDRRREAVQHAVGRLSEETGRLRDLITDLRPAVLDSLGLEAALRALRDRVATDRGLVAALTMDGGVRELLTPEVETVAYRIVQESLGNAARHADARRVSVDVSTSGIAVEVRVADDGVGFDPEEAVGADRFGLLGMRERAQLLGGSLRIESARGAGTTVLAHLPVEVG